MKQLTRGPVLIAVVVALIAILAVVLIQRRAADVWLTFGSQPEWLAMLEASRDDQRRLAEEHPEQAAHYRQRFDTLDTLLRRLRVMEHSRGTLLGRYRWLLGGSTLVAGVALLCVLAWRHRRRAERLAGLQTALVALVDGRTDIDLGPARRDLIGRIGAMVERTSRIMARDRRRLGALRNLSAWQEAARRHAHEMRTPLTGARLELARVEDLAARELPAQAEAIRRATRSVLQELDRLGHFTQAFTSFARLPRPRLVDLDLRSLVEEFVTTFGDAWPRLRLAGPAPVADPTLPERCFAAVDRDMIRQVLVNLCDNAALAIAPADGTVRIVVTETEPGMWALDVADDGPGVAEAVRDQLFEPYTTTRGIGEGMGLGLAISRKLMLDQDGDLELHATSAEGTTFRLSFPARPDPHAATVAADAHRSNPAVPPVTAPARGTP